MKQKQLTAAVGSASRNYQLINEKYQIASCRIGDLSGEQAAAMLKQLSGDRLSALTAFYDRTEDMLVLNREHRFYEQYRRIAEQYIQSPVEARELFGGRSWRELMAELQPVLDRCLLARHNSRELFILSRQKVCADYDLSESMLRAIKEEHSNYGEWWLMYMAYKYGMIQGKRLERAGRKTRQGTYRADEAALNM